jgi:DnaJ-class molecular chaperone
MLSPEDPIIARKVQKLARVVSQVNRKAHGKKKGRYGSDVDLNDDDDDEFSSKTPKLYKILDCRQTARPKQIAKAYKTQAMKWHPDKQHSKDEAAKLEAEARFKQIVFAFSVLSDKKKRAEYDEDNTKYDQML